VIAGLLFVPTGIFDMIWGVRYLQEGRAFDYADAVLRSSLVPLGWIVGCPLLGWISDRLGRRKPVIATAGILLAACLGFILYGPADVLPPYVLGFLTGVVSGAAMLPYTVIKEANPQHLGGTATGVVNFINFTFSALLGPVFARLLLRAAADADPMRLEHYQSAFAPMLFGVGLAVVLTFVLKETGTAARARAAVPAESAT
jgi:sugar phosphate permease